MSGIVKNVEIGDEKNQKDYYDKASHYDTVWGQDNIHLGYYPHIATGDLVKLDNVQAADYLTKKMIEMAKIDHKTTLLDLGCGKGQACRVIAEATGATCIGVDLSTNNIIRANDVAKQHPHLKMKFYEGSFTEVPAEVAAQKYDVIFSQVAFCHVHAELPKIFEHVKTLMRPDSLFVCNDYMGGKKPPSQLTRDNVHKRLHFEHLHTHREWRRIAEDAGFVIEMYEDLDRHQSQTYRDMEGKARQVGFKSADGVALADNYRETYKAIDRGETGMNLCLLTLGLPPAQPTLVDSSRVYVKKVDYAEKGYGAGVFAKGPIFKGELVERGIVRRLPPGFDGNDSAYVFTWSESEPRVWAHGSGASTFYNMSDEPNCEMKRNFKEDSFEIFAIRDIAENEELTHVYISSAWRKCFADMKPILESYQRKSKL